MKFMPWFVMVVSAMSLVFTGCFGGSTDGGSTTGVAVSELTIPPTGTSVAPLILTGNIGIGSATIWNNTTDLNLVLNADPLLGWKFNEILIFAGTGDIPRDPVGGWPDFSRFNYGRSYYPGVASHEVSFTLADILGDTASVCGRNVNVAVYIVASRYDDAGNVIETSYGWGWGEGTYGCSCYGTSFTHTLTCEPPPSRGCTRTYGYWKTHHDRARGPLRVDWPAPWDERQQLCSASSQTLLQNLSTNAASGNAYIILSHQYIAARLNIAAGASSTVQVDAALAAAQALLDANCGQNVHSSTTIGQQMVVLAGVLDAYNNGLTGPGHCR